MTTLDSLGWSYLTRLAYVGVWEEIFFNVGFFVTLMIIAKIFSVLWKLRTGRTKLNRHKLSINKKKRNDSVREKQDVLSDTVKKPDHCHRVTNRKLFISELKVGQHYAVRREYLTYPLYHHFLITGLEERAVKLIHYNGTAEGFLSSAGKVFGCVYEEALSYSDTHLLDIPDNLFHIKDPSYPKEEERITEIICRAQARVGENRYGITYNNCEHFVRWAMTGEPQCQQYDYANITGKVVGAMIDELPHIGIRFTLKLCKEVLYGLTMGVEQLILQSSARLVQHTASATVAGILSTGAATFGWTAPVEAAFLTFRILDWKFHKSRGTMSIKDYNNAKDKAITGSVFSLVMTTLGAIAGQLVVPLPAVGAVFGSFWGGFTGRILGIVLAGYGIAVREKYLQSSQFNRVRIGKHKKLL